MAEACWHFAMLSWLLLEEHVAQGDTSTSKLPAPAAFLRPQVVREKARVVEYLSDVLKCDWGLGPPALPVQLFDFLR